MLLKWLICVVLGASGAALAWLVLPGTLGSVSGWLLIGLGIAPLWGGWRRLWKLAFFVLAAVGLSKGLGILLGPSVPASWWVVGAVFVSANGVAVWKTLRRREGTPA